MRGQNTSQDCFVANTLVNPPLHPPFSDSSNFTTPSKAVTDRGECPIFARLTKHLSALFQHPYTPPLEGEQAVCAPPCCPFCAPR